jgi:outer membrane biosynthesis protein TonB
MFHNIRSSMKEAELKNLPNKRIRLIWALVLAAGLLLAGCAGAITAVPTSPVEVSKIDNSLPQETVITEPASAESVQAEPAGVESQLTATLPPTQSTDPTDQPDPKPTARAELHASDPSGVTLAAGKPQLIEFFAFW